MVASPIKAEAVKANHAARRSPRQGVRASSSNRALSSGSRGLGEEGGIGTGTARLDASFQGMPV